MLATFLTILFVLAGVCLGLTRVLGVHQEQKTAIEAAALAAAKDLSRVVIEDEHLGFIGLSDKAPTGLATRGQDGCFNSVKSINTVFATIRLDLLVADKLNNPTMKALCKIDYDKAVLARAALKAKLLDAIQPNGSVLDADGNSISPYTDAVETFKTHIVRLSGNPVTLVPNSVKLELGVVDGLVTNTQIPNSVDGSFVSQSQQENNCYKAFQNIPYNGYAFNFTAAGDDVLLLDSSKFKPEQTTSTDVLADVVRCEAAQETAYSDGTGSARKLSTKVVACAQPFNSIDIVPAPGSFELRFPHGTLPEVMKLGDIFLNTGLLNSPSDYLETPLNSDCPTSGVVPLAPPVINSEHPPFGKVISLSFYDWVRRARHRLNVKSLIDNLNLSFGSAAGPTIYRFDLMQNGSVNRTAITDNPSQVVCVSNKQYQAISGMIINSKNGSTYDAYLRDFCYRPGRSAGGTHAGEPLDTSGTTSNDTGLGRPLDEQRSQTLIFSNQSGTRSTYTTSGRVVQLTLRKRN